MRRRISSIVALAMTASLVAVPAMAQPQECVLVDESTEEVAEGVNLTWDSSFFCADAADAGEYQATTTISNDSDASVTLDGLGSRGTTPRPGGQGPETTAEATGLPVVVGAGGSAAVTISGTYVLVETDEGTKATIHLSIEGSAGDESFSLGVNVHIRGVGAVEEDGEDGNGDEGGPPFAVPPAGPNAATEVLTSEVGANQTNDDGGSEDSADGDDDTAGLEEAIANLEEEVPGDADEVRANVKAMLEYILANQPVADDPTQPGAFGQGVADLARGISDEDEDDGEVPAGVVPGGPPAG